MADYPDTKEMKSLLPDASAGLFYQADFLTKEQSDYYFHQLKSEVAWEQKVIRIFGKEVPEPRLTAWYGDATAIYTYSGIEMQPRPWIPILLDLKQLTERACAATFNSGLLNYYRQGNDSMGWHRDNEKELGKEPLIASVSLGSARTFQVRHYQDKRNKLELDLAPGSLLIMSGTMQENWQHAIPKRKKSEGERINITFRTIF